MGRRIVRLFVRLSRPARAALFVSAGLLAGLSAGLLLADGGSVGLSAEVVVEDLSAAFSETSRQVAASGGKVTSVEFDLAEDGSGWIRLAVELPTDRAPEFAADLLSQPLVAGSGRLPFSGSFDGLAGQLAVLRSIQAGELSRFDASDLAALPADALTAVTDRMVATALERDRLVAELDSARVAEATSSFAVQLLSPPPPGVGRWAIRMLLGLLAAVVFSVGLWAGRSGRTASRSLDDRERGLV